MHIYNTAPEADYMLPAKALRVDFEEIPVGVESPTSRPLKLLLVVWLCVYECDELKGR